MTTRFNLGFFNYAKEHQAELEKNGIRIKGLGNPEERDDPTALFHQSNRGETVFLALINEINPLPDEIYRSRRTRELQPT